MELPKTKRQRMESGGALGLTKRTREQGLKERPKWNNKKSG